MSDKLQSPGRKANEAQPLGRRDGLVDDEKATEIGKSALTRPGPDGVHPDEIGDTYKKKPRSLT
ncbi:MAG: hypothetical protein KA105_09980 [Caulobacter sp.]|nr:hypothetical protein [Caulobacter sp.]